MMPWSHMVSGLYVVLCLIFVAARTYDRFRSPKRQDSHQPTENREPLLNRIGLALCAVTHAALVAAYDWHETFGFPGWVGSFGFTLGPIPRCILLVCGILALAGLAWSHHTLGTFYCVRLALRKEHVIIRKGPYAHIRHPMYAGLAAFFMCSSGASANALLILSSLALTTCFLVRVPREEKMMRGHFGAQYENYIQETGALWPRWDRRPH